MNEIDDIVCVKCSSYSNGFCKKHEKEVYEDNWCMEHNLIPF